jgi:hypothetical protein
MDVESDQVQPKEPKVPPPEMVSMEIQTDESFLPEQQHGSSSKEELPAPSGSFQKGEEPEEKKDVFRKMTRLQKKNLPHVFTMIKVSLEMKMTLSSENFLSVLAVTIMVIGQVFTIRVIQLQVNIHICSGMSSTGRPINLTKTIGTPPISSWWKLTLPGIKMNTHYHC